MQHQLLGNRGFVEFIHTELPCASIEFKEEELVAVAQIRSKHPVMSNSEIFLVLPLVSESNLPAIGI